MHKVRPLRIGAFAVRDHVAVVADEVLPIAVEVDTGTGDVIAAHTWAPSAAHRGKPAAASVALTLTEVLVASPAAGGLVRIDRRSGLVETLALPWSPGWVRAGSVAWVGPAVDEDEAEPGPGSRYRPVVWEEKPEPTVGERQASGWFAYAPLAKQAGDDLVRAGDAIAHWQAQGDEVEEVVPAPAALLRLGADGLSFLELDAVVDDVAMAGGTLVALGRLPDDPLVKVAERSSVSYVRPGTVLAITEEGTVAELGKVPSTDGTVFAAGGRVWALACDREGFGYRKTVRPVNLAAGALGAPIAQMAHEPVAVMSGHIVGLVWAAAEPGVPRTTGDRQANLGPAGRHHRTVVLTPLGGGPTREVPIAATMSGPVVACDGVLWLNHEDPLRLVAVNIEEGSARVLDVIFDCTPLAPAPVPPPGIDLGAHEAAQLGSFRSELLEGWRTEDGSVLPFIEGVSFDSVGLRGEFPYTEVVALFRSDEHPGVRFGRSWRLYDDLGDVTSTEYAGIGLMEDVLAEGHGLPPLQGCLTDEEGTVWF